MNVKVNESKNTILVSFERSSALLQEQSLQLRKELFTKLVKPFTNVIVNFNHVNDIDYNVIEALKASQRLSQMNKGQVSLYNVKDKVYAALCRAKVDHMFFFCDRPKPFSREVLMA